jgi:hypothetical protein
VLRRAAPGGAPGPSSRVAVTRSAGPRRAAPGTRHGSARA